jgi:WD40 repeat protein/serine/threonine protein kinase
MADTNDDRDVMLNDLADEFAARQRNGERPRVEDYCDRHPTLAADIRSLFPAMVELERVKADAGPELALETADAPPITELGDFRLLREVGRGGMGVVYEAEQVSLGRRVALKLLPTNLFRDPVKRRRFEREAKAAAKLHHTNIVPVHGFGEHDGTPYYVMQFIPGLGLDAVIDELGSLPGRSPGPDRTSGRGQGALSVALARSLLGDGGPGTAGRNVAADGDPTLTSAGSATPDPGVASRPTPRAPASASSSGVYLPGQPGAGMTSATGKGTTYWESVARIGVQVAGALAYAHRLGVLHRDIKPANLLLDLDGVVWVTDFGLAKADDSDNLTHTGDLLGTLRYMPPEAFEGKSDVRSDIYALGLTLFELVALRPAYEERDRNRLVKQMTTGDPPRLRKLRTDAPRDLVTIVEKAIDKDPARRYQSAGALADDLQRFLDDEPIKARRQTTVETVWRWARRHRTVATLTAVVLLLLVAITAGSVVAAAYFRDQEKEQRGLVQMKAALAERNLQLAEANKAAKKSAEDALEKAEVSFAEARQAETDAKEQRGRADNEAEVARQNLYYAQMHLARQAWREHRGVAHMREILANWLPRGESPDRRGWEWFYLNSLPYQNLRTFTESGASKGPCTVAWHAASKRLAEGTADGLIRIWDVDREQTTLTLRAPAPWVQYWGGRWLGWSPDGGKLVAGCKDGTVHVWEAGSGREVTVLRGHRSPVNSVAYSSDGTRVAAWANDGAIKIWEAGTGRLTADVVHPTPRPVGGPGGVTAGAWSPDDKLLATGHGDGTVTISGAHAGATIVTLRAHVDWIYHLAWSPDSARLASTSANDFFVSVWDVATGKMVLGPLRHSHGITAIAWEPDGKRLATGSIDETVKVWTAATGHEDLTLRGHRASSTSLAWGPGGRLASGGSDGSMRVWDSVHDQESSALSGHVGRATAVSWSPDGKRLASGGDDGQVRIWDAVTREKVLTLKGHDKSRINPQFGLIRSLAWSPDGARLASAGLDGTAKVWEVASGREVFALPADRGPVWSVAWSWDGTHLAAGSEDGTIRVIEGLQQTPKVHAFKAHQGRVRGLSWSPRGHRLASVGADSLVKLWDPIRGAELARMEGHEGWVMAVSWSPDGKRLASASGNRLVFTWDAETGRRLKTMRGHNDFVDAVVWSPDGTRLASAGVDNSVRVWDPQTGEEAFVLRGNSGMFHDVSWHPEGAQLAAACSDGHIWIWDATRGFERDTTPRAMPYVERKVASGTARGEDRLWYAESFLRAGRPTEAVAAVQDDPYGLCKLARRFAELGHPEPRTGATPCGDATPPTLRGRDRPTVREHTRSGVRELRSRDGIGPRPTVYGRIGLEDGAQAPQSQAPAPNLLPNYLS